MDTTISAATREYVGVHHDDRLRETTVARRPWRAIEAVTTTAIRHELDRLPDVDHADGARAILYRRHLEARVCAARLQEAIDDAELWYAQARGRAAPLRPACRRDRPAAGIRGRVRPTLTWSPHGPVAAEPSAPAAEVIAFAVHRRPASPALQRSAEAA